uniref:Protein kinase domain-containing protein n=1 Tax=Oreochromis aureus TaxID=47969 RepID=A0AAZ1WVF4_OREAU
NAVDTAVEAFLGEGGFGIVAKCRDTKTNRAVAIKVNKSRPDILQQAKLEIFILEQLRRLDPDAANIVKWDGFFHDGERVCLNFELLDQCLEVGPILRQLTNALSHLGSVGIVHADLKSGNIMVVNRHESPIKVKLIDFGLACPASAVMPGDRVGTVGYSAPEVMLGLPFNEASDMWSLGLVAVELGTGVPLYPGNEDYDVLKFIIETQGQPPDHVLDSVMMFTQGPENGQRLFVSLIKQMLALDANQQIFGENFGLNAKVQWFGKGGMCWSGVLPRFYEELSTQSPPDILVIHAGGNDLGLMSAYQLSSVIEKELMQLHTEFPSMTIVYSSINERQVWRYGNPGQINKDRKIVNASIRKAVNRFAGVIIEHPCLRFFNNSIFLPDGVHLNKKGNELFLKSIRSAIQQSLQSPHRKLT